VDTVTDDMRVAVIGAGMMGADHVRRITERISGARVVAVVDADAQRAAAVADSTPGAVARPDATEVLADPNVDALLIATPGQFHESILAPALERGLPVFCEKPLTLDAASSLRIVELEQKRDRPVVQVGFMRRFDAGFRRLKDVADQGALGELLLLHCRHRNASSHLVNSEALLIQDSVVHEFDIIAWLTGSELATIEVRKPRSSRHAPDGLADPQLVLIETESGVIADVEIFINARYGYEVSTEAVFEEGVAAIGQPTELVTRTSYAQSMSIAPTFVERFRDAYDTQLQRWVNAARNGAIDGPSAWDGYRAAVACEAGILAQASGERVRVGAAPTPDFYRNQVI
jgi:myo-inositol 2-dehydrogenase/D-chiro-inositol 1-dehydrogenase